MNKHEVIKSALKNALVKMRAAQGIGWSYSPLLVIEERPGISASVAQRDELTLWISEGCIDDITRLQKEIQVTLDVSHALEWLILHELHHADLAHFDLIHGTLSLHLASRSKRKVTPLDDIPTDMHDKVGPCLELQADHDALELMLGDYSTASWSDICMITASIAALMVLIEGTDAENGIEQSTHPKAATRIFQLLGHVVEMWSTPAHANAKARSETSILDVDLPCEEELQAFSKGVILPVFWDSMALAEAAGAEPIIADLGSPESFFADVSRAKLGHWDELVTAGAREWAALKEANELILPLLPINQATN